MLGGDYIFDMQYLRSLAAELQAAGRSIVYNLNAMTGDRYPRLVDTLKRIEGELQAVLESRIIAPQTELVIPLERIDEDLTDVVGAKMARLGAIKRRLDCLVPEGFVITTYACQRVLEEAGIDHDVEEWFTRGGPFEDAYLAERAGRLREKVAHVRLPKELTKAINRSAVQFRRRAGCPRLAVRSSALGEDSELSFAGQFSTVLGVPPEDVESAYREVLASLYSFGVMKYRQGHELHPARGLMAVGCLCMVPAQAGGVLYSLDPARPDRDVMVVAVARGLGKTVVDGSAPVDRFEVSRSFPHATLGQWIVSKDEMLVAAHDRGVERVRLGQEESSRPALTEAQLQQLAEIGLRIEKYMKCAVDVEWAFDGDGRLFILQARPLRVVSGAPREARDLTDVVQRHHVLMKNLGTVACNGIGCGRVYVVKDDDTLEDLPHDVVLVARTSTARLAAAVAGASAVVTDVGLSTGHLAAIAREFRVPAIVDTGQATQLLKDGEEVTVDAEENAIYQGCVKELLDHQLLRSSSLEDTKEFRLLRRMLKWIAPLNLRDPQSRSFAADKCSTYHDIIRFAHEKAVQELIDEDYWVSPSKRTRFVRRLDLHLPLDLVVIDLGGALKASEGTRTVRAEDVTSEPLRALLGGLTEEGVWATGPARMDPNAFMASATRSAPWLGPAEARPQQNLALVSAQYMNLSLRLGFHFNIVDCYMSEVRNDNYVYFRFTGGVTELTRRSRRAALLRKILEKSDFIVESKGDLVIGRLKKISSAAMAERLSMIGRLIGFTRQLDILLLDDGMVDACVDAFLSGRFNPFGSEPGGQAAPD